MFPILRCTCGAVTGNPKYRSVLGLSDPHAYRVRKYFEAALLKRPLPPIEDLVEPYICDRCKIKEEARPPGRWDGEAGPDTM